MLLGLSSVLQNDVSRYMCPWSTKAVISNRYICSNRQQYIVWVKIIHFSFMPKIIRILRSRSIKIFPTVNISKLNFWLVICIAKNFIWTTLKVIFSIFRFFCTLRFSNSCISAKYCPIITNHTSMESYLFSFQMMYTSQFQKINTYDWFCAPHVLVLELYRTVLMVRYHTVSHLASVCGSWSCSLTGVWCCIHRTPRPDCRNNTHHSETHTDALLHKHSSITHMQTGQKIEWIGGAYAPHTCFTCAFVVT